MHDLRKTPLRSVGPGVVRPSLATGASGRRVAPVVQLPIRKAPPKREPHELLRGVLEGDGAAQAEVWDVYAPVLRGVLRRSLGPWAEVEDLLQDVFLTFFRVASTLRDPAALRPFLIGIAMRVARGELRKRRVRRWFFLTDDGNVPDAPAPAGDDEAREAVRRLYAILDRLDAESRLAFVLRHIEGLELEEVARSLDLSLATTKRRLAKVVPVVQARVRADALLARYAEESPSTDDDAPLFGRRLAEGAK